jgi:hypothetical protein
VLVHLNYHPSIPLEGLGYRTAQQIYMTCARQIYRSCYNRGLRSLWAYLWSHWYRPARWILWARSAHPLIPVWRTTMAVESQWRVIKRDYLGKGTSSIPSTERLIVVLGQQFIPKHV